MRGRQLSRCKRELGGQLLRRHDCEGGGSKDGFQVSPGGGAWRKDDNCVRRGGRKNSCGVGGGSVTRGNWLFGFKDLK